MSAQNLAKISLVSDEVTPAGDSVTDEVITVTVIDTADGFSVSVSPSLLQLKNGTYNLAWQVDCGTADWSITSISLPTAQNFDGVWHSSWTNDLSSGQPGESFHYTIGLTNSSTRQAVIDPVIENDPPPPGSALELR